LVAMPLLTMVLGLPTATPLVALTVLYGSPGRSFTLSRTRDPTGSLVDPAEQGAIEGRRGPRAPRPRSRQLLALLGGNHVESRERRGLTAGPT
jgi:hypothetical protein